MSRAKDIKKSNFVAVTSALVTDYFDLVRSGQNFRILLSDLITSMGVSGPLQTKGEATAVPILDVVAGVNYIRNLLAGDGIRLDYSPQDGIEINHNFIVDKTGVPVVINELTNAPTIRSIQAGTGITVSGSGGIIQISESTTPGTTKTVFVYTESDLPTPSLGIITLADDTEYRFLNDVSTSNRFIMGDNCVISAADEGLISLTYTGTGVMFTAADKTSSNFTGIKLSCPSGTCFDMSSTTGNDSFFMSNCDVVCDTIGDLDGMAFNYIRNCQIIATNTGLSFANAHLAFLCYNTYFNLSTATTAKAIDLGTATFTAIHIDVLLFNMDAATSYCISGAAASANLVATGFATVIRCQQLGSSTFLENISEYDDKWEFALNANAINSKDLALATHAGATIAIGAAATPVIVGATWAQQDMHRFTHTISGRWTYTGKGTNVDITASISADIVTGTDNVTFFLYKDGVQITNSAITREFTAGNIGNMSLIWNLQLETNDYIELWVQNDDTAVDVIIDSIVMRISG